VDIVRRKEVTKAAKGMGANRLFRESWILEECGVFIVDGVIDRKRDMKNETGYSGEVESFKIAQKVF